MQEPEEVTMSVRLSADRATLPIVALCSDQLATSTADGGHARMTGWHILNFERMWGSNRASERWLVVVSFG
jgi:hypothetical protein